MNDLIKLAKELTAAIASVKQATSADDPWIAEDIWSGDYDPSNIARSIATILNAVVGGALIPSDSVFKVKEGYEAYALEKSGRGYRVASLAEALEIRSADEVRRDDERLTKDRDQLLEAKTNWNIRANDAEAEVIALRAHADAGWDQYRHWIERYRVAADQRDAALARATAAEADAERLAAQLDIDRRLVSEAAMTGFRWDDGDWAERLFKNNGQITAALDAHTQRVNAKEEV